LRAHVAVTDVTVAVDQRWHNRSSASINHPRGSIRLYVHPHGYDLVAIHKNRSILYRRLAGSVNQLAILDQSFHLFSIESHNFLLGRRLPRVK
jgi:hypothetical protein